MSKHDLKARPIFHHTKDAIQAHLTVVTTALAITLPNGQTLQASTPLNPQAQEIIQAPGH